MEMSIDKSTEVLADYIDTYEVCGGNGYNPATNITQEACEAFEMAVDTMRKYQQLQAAYEARLKADLKAILVELQLQMEEYEPKWVENDDQAVASCRTWEDLDRIIQNKINTLEEER